jgi:hypothetical protein
MTVTPRLRRLPDGRTATLEGLPRCRLAGCCYTTVVPGGLCQRHAYAAEQRRYLDLRLRLGR